MSRKGATEALLLELGDAALGDLGLTLIRYVKQWEDSGNPHWIDLATSFLERNNASVPRALLQIAAEIARRRISGFEQAAGGPSVMKAEEYGLAFACMAFLIARGSTKGEAAGHAANALAAMSGKKITAGTLERKYGEDRAVYTQWEDVCRVLLENDPEAAEQFWVELSKLDVVPKGTRR